MLIKKLTNISFKASAGMVFPEAPADNFIALNKPDTMNASNFAYRFRSETSEIDYDSFQKKFKEVEELDFNGKYSELEEITIPGISDKYHVCFDNYMIGNYHILVLPRANRSSFSECKEKDGVECDKTINAVKETLLKMYPDRNIYYAEHGSGTANSQISDKKAGTSLSLSHAHAHFIIPYENYYPSLEKHLIPLLEGVLQKSGWDDIEKNKHEMDSVKFENFKVDNPYLHVGVISPDGTEKSVIYEKKKDSELVPSQVLRLLYNVCLDPFSEKPDNPLLWDWKRAKTSLTDKHPDAFAILMKIAYQKGNYIRFWDRFLDIKKENKL